MARRYDKALLDKIRQGQFETEYKGITVLVKPIPEGGADGEVDPRLFKAMRMMPLMLHFIPKAKKNATVAEQIAMPRKMFGEYKGDYVVTEGVDTQHITVKSADGYALPVRIYKRNNAGSGLPMLVYYHGGGFFGGGPDIVEQMCKVLVRDLDCVVLNVDYRLCPEEHYPQPFDDCWAATCWAYEHAEELGAAEKKIAVSGGSENMLEDVYLQGNLKSEHIYASPILDDFHDVPPTLLAFGEHDFLAFEDFAYARHAAKAGVNLKTIIYRGLGHGFADQVGVMPQAEDLMAEIASMMREVL